MLFMIASAVSALLQSPADAPRLSWSANLTQQDAIACGAESLAGADRVLMLSHNDDARKYRIILSNSALAKPVEVAGGAPGVQFFQGPADSTKPFVVLVPICKPLGNRFWDDTHNHSAEYNSRFNALVVRPEGPQLYKGLVLFHEMRHAYQTHALEFRSAGGLAREADAFTFEFSILDSMHLPGYDDLMQSEVERVRSVVGQGKPLSGNLDNPLLARVFGSDQLTPAARGALAGEVLIRTLFFFCEKAKGGTEVNTCKQNALKSIGYSD